MTVALQSLCRVLRRGSQFFLLFVWVFHMATAERKIFFFFFFEEAAANVIVKSNSNLQGREGKGAGTQTSTCLAPFSILAPLRLLCSSQTAGPGDVIFIVCSKATQKETPAWGCLGGFPKGQGSSRSA